jgi:MerR family transcriptional regulator, light-induced transcriptional regulator
MNVFTIKDLENLSGIKAHTIRIWEQRYNFLKPNRSDTNIRYYSNDELKKILNIALLNKYGYKISHIDKMNETELKEKILSLTQMQAQQERIVNDLIKCMVDLDMDAFEEILDKYILSRGIERSITQIIFPFLEKIGVLWLTNHINPAQEHLVSNIIRQKLIVGIEGATSSVPVTKSVLLFLPEGEHHEMGLLFAHYLLKSRGVPVIYLGANIPLQDVEYVARLKKPAYLFTHLTCCGQNFSMEKFITGVTKRFTNIPIIISGRLTHAIEKKIPQHIALKKSYQEVVEFITSI